MIALAQVAAIMTIMQGEGVTLVRNPAPQPVRITIALVRDTNTAERIGRPVLARIAPHAFTLGPGEAQRVRIILREPVPGGTLLRLCTTFTPADADAPAPGSDRVAVARLIVVTRLVSKVHVQ